MKGIARGTTLHSRLVAWLKVVLPLLALVILSTLFLVSRAIDPDDAIPYARVDVEERAREPRMTAPTYSGVTSDGSSLTLTADAARPASEGNAGTATRVHATLVTRDGAESSFSAATAALDTAGRRLDLAGGVEIVTAEGFTITTDSLVAALDRTDVRSGGPVTATGPLGTLNAGGMTLTQAGDPASHVLLFQRGVKLVYLPQQYN
jgi:lipopolysaccharide export system protein LptC